MTRESDVEKYSTKLVEAIGGLSRKLQWVNRRNAPDRFVAYKGVVVLVEYKAPHKKPRPAQEREIERLKAAGVWVRVVSTRLEAEALVAELKAFGDALHA